MLIHLISWNFMPPSEWGHKRRKSGQTITRFCFSVPLSKAPALHVEETEGRGGRARDRKPMEKKRDNDDSDRPVRSVAVIGAGISGLAAAYKLKSSGVSVTIFEAAEKAGGKIRSGSQDGFVWDEGANTMTESEVEVRCLIDNLGLREQQQYPISQNKRYIAKNGIPKLMPSNPVALITSNFLSTKSKIQVLLEPLIWKRSNAKVGTEYLEESVGHFFRRHFGTEVVDLLIDPFVAGTSGGDPESLSMRHSFPEIWNLEKRYGSVIAGAIKSKLSTKDAENRTTPRAKSHNRGSFSFHGGMQTLIDMLCSKLGKENLRCGSKVLSLCYKAAESCNDWTISCSSNYSDLKKHSLDQSFDAVIMTAPGCNVQEMEFRKEGSPLDVGFLPKVSYVPLSVLITSFRKENVKRPLEGFGVLVPSQEQANGLKTLGTLFSSAMFPDRAPADQYLYTTFIGGSRNRDLAGASLDELEQIAISDLQQLLGVEGQPTFIKHVFWKNAFPLYGHDYELVLEGIKKLEERLPGFFYAGNHKDGLSVGKAIVSGCNAADRAISYLNLCFADDA